MQRFLAFGLLLSILILGACREAAPDLRVMTYNIRHGVGMDRVRDLKRIVEVVQAVQPDLLILNEVDHGTGRSQGELQAELLGEWLDMDAWFGRSIDYDGGQYGNALLSRFPVTAFEIHDLSVDSTSEGRSVFEARVVIDTDTVVILGTHLGLTPAERQLQVQRIMALIPRDQLVILVGDFNLEAGEAEYAVIVAQLRDSVAETVAEPPATYPADAPGKRIDYIFCSPDLRPVRQITVPAPARQASDHLPVIMDLSFD